MSELRLGEVFRLLNSKIFSKENNTVNVIITNPAPVIVVRLQTPLTTTGHLVFMPKITNKVQLFSLLYALFCHLTI